MLPKEIWLDGFIAGVLVTGSGIFFFSCFAGYIKFRNKLRGKRNNIFVQWLFGEGYF